MYEPALFGSFYRANDGYGLLSHCERINPLGDASFGYSPGSEYVFYPADKGGNTYNGTIIPVRDQF